MIENTAKIKIEVMRFLSLVVSDLEAGLVELSIGCAFALSTLL
jgi:hypothetical protein